MRHNLLGIANFIYITMNKHLTFKPFLKLYIYLHLYPVSANNMTEVVFVVHFCVLFIYLTTNPPKKIRISLNSLVKTALTEILTTRNITYLSRNRISKSFKTVTPTIFQPVQPSLD